MNIKVMYHSSTGNTRKVADAIAAVLNTQAESVDNGQLSASKPIDLLFIGDGLYGGKPSKQMISFIDQLGPAVVKNVAVFATYGGQAVIGERIQKLLQDKGLNVMGKPFTCKGKCWVIINRKHPDENDLEIARQFAKSIAANVKV